LQVVMHSSATEDQFVDSVNQMSKDRRQSVNEWHGGHATQASRVPKVVDAQ